MSTEFIIYMAITGSAWLLALLLVKPRNAVDLSRCAGWYLLVFLATYILRPAASQVMGDFSLYTWLKIGRFEDHWQMMAVAVSLAILSFGAGYAAPAVSRPAKSFRTRTKEPYVDPHKVRVLIFFLVALGYLSLIVGIKSGTITGSSGDYEGAAVGVYEHNTAWFAEDDRFVSTGAVLYYILTDRLGMSLLIAGPWVIFRIMYGWGRSHLLGHFFALMAVYFLKLRGREKPGVTRRQVLVLVSSVALLLMLFPALSAFRGLKEMRHISAASFSSEDLSLFKMGADPETMIQTYAGTNSSITGFEQTLTHLINDPRPELGTQYLYFYFIKPIPRILWPGKGTPYTWPEKLVGVQADPLLALIGAAPGSIGMAYQQWGWLGIPFEFLLTGWVIRKMEEATRRRTNALHITLAYAGLYSLIPQLGRDSLLYMVANFWLFKDGIPVAILWMISYAAAARSRAQKLRGAAPASVPVPG